MKKYSKIFSLIALTILCSCENESLPGAESQLSSMTFSASVEGSSSLAKTTLDFHTVKWEASDKISLFSGKDLAVKTELSIKDEGKIDVPGTDVTLEGSAVAGSSEYLAVYPYAAANALDGNTLTVLIPSEQDRKSVV